MLVDAALLAGGAAEPMRAVGDGSFAGHFSRKNNNLTYY